ncbi:MAG TPA: YciI family protein [Candidatus Limnocylindria bacterium]|nr:YciI family protein [Candidatus Limnocylindria bacterium]
MPRFMVIVPGDERSETGELPSTELLAEMQKYNEQLVKAGVMLAGEGLKPTSAATKVRFEGGKRTVVDGPFAETKELAGFWIWQTKSREEAVEWLKRAPFDGGTEIVIREIFENEDFGENLTPEMRRKEDELRAAATRLQKERSA